MLKNLNTKMEKERKKTDEEIIKLVQRASQKDYGAVDEIHQLGFWDRARIFELISEGKV